MKRKTNLLVQSILFSLVYSFYIILSRNILTYTKEWCHNMLATQHYHQCIIHFVDKFSDTEFLKNKKRKKIICECIAYINFVLLYPVNRISTCKTITSSFAWLNCLLNDSSKYKWKKKNSFDKVANTQVLKYTFRIGRHFHFTLNCFVIPILPISCLIHWERKQT